VIRALRGLGLVLAALAAAVLFYVVAGMAGGLVGAQRTAEGPVRVGLLIGPIHTDLLIPLTPEVRARLGDAAVNGVPVDDPRAEWLVAGWGARQFYTTAGTWADVTAGALFRGVTGDTAVLRLDALGRIGDFGDMAFLTMDEATLLRLVDRIVADVPPGAPPLDHPGFTATDAFWPATGRFDIFRTCNVWVGEVLRDAGVAWGLWTPTPQAVRLSLWRFHAG
jgi:uncharacterized protein (TIGR02117 family)